MNITPFFDNTVTPVFFNSRDKGMFLMKPTNEFLFKLPVPLNLDAKGNYHFCLKSLALPNTIVNIKASDSHGFTLNGTDFVLPDCSITSLLDLNREAFKLISTGLSSVPPPFRLSLDPYMNTAVLYVATGNSVTFTTSLASMIGFRDGVVGPFGPGDYYGLKIPDFLGSAYRVINFKAPSVVPRLNSSWNNNVLYSFTYDPKPDRLYSYPVKEGSLAFVPTIGTTLNEFAFSFSSARTGEILRFDDLENFPISFQLDIVRKSFPF